MLGFVGQMSMAVLQLCGPRVGTVRPLLLTPAIELGEVFASQSLDPVGLASFGGNASWPSK